MDSVFGKNILGDRDTLQVMLDALRADYITQIGALQARLDLVMRSGQNMCFTAAGLLIGTDAKKLKVANTVVAVVDGVFMTVTTEEIVHVDTTVQSISTFKKYLLSYPVAGTGSGVITQGNEAVSAVLALLPAVPAGHVAVGYWQAATSGAGTFVPATDDQDDAAVTETYVDLAWPNSGASALSTALGTLTGSTPAAIGDLGQY